MGEITTVGLDLAKSVFQVHAVDAEGRVAIRRQVRRQQLVKFFAGLSPCLIDMEACATPTPGPASSLLSAMRSALCPQPM